MSTVYINNQYLPAEKATISIFDRGFLFGDAVYEVIPVYNRQVRFADEHLQRLAYSLKQARINPPDCDFMAIFERLLAKETRPDCQLYIQVTRGNQGQRKHDIPPQLDAGVVVFTLHTPFPTLEQKVSGLHAITVPDFRWHRCDIKSTSLLANILINDQAVSAGAHTAIMLREGRLTEGGTSNIFIVDDEGCVKTSPLDDSCLPGVTRAVTILLLKQLGVPVQECLIQETAFRAAREIWITSTTKEIFPVSQLDGQIVGNGQPSALWHQLNTLYQQLVR